MWSSVLLSCLILLHCSMAIASSRHPYNVGDCDALLHFGNSFTISEYASQIFNFDPARDHDCDPSYPKTKSWKNGTDCCSWDGVTCHAATNSVIGLDLSCSWLQGSLHPNSSLFSLPNLRWLNLAANDFVGSQIPSRFGIFSGMEHLNFTHSRFSGNVPREIYLISSLITLDLSGNDKLKVEDHSFGRLLRNLTQLRELVLDSVDMSRVSPNSFSNLSSTLTTLSLRYCSLQGLSPNAIFRLPNLRSLDLSYNVNLTGTLPQTNWTAPLVSLDISGTKFNGSIPASLGNLTSLNYLSLCETTFTGVVPSTLGNLDQLTYLDLELNYFSGSVDFEMFARLKNLEILSLDGVNLLLQSNGNCSFPRLRELSLFYCNLTTEFPYFLSSSNKLESLDLSENVIGGPIPEWFRKIGMYSLRYLDLSSNKIAGEIPSLICQLSSLERLDLSNNSLHGTIPGCLGNLSMLYYLSLNDNLLQGQLPQSLANCTSLRYLLVGNNGIYDTFPDWFNATDRLHSIDLQSNKFHGVIEVPIPSLATLLLSNNNFSGQLPANFLRNSIVDLIDLSNNSFDGPLPVPRAAQYYSVSRNKFNGEVPDQLCNTTWLEIIDLSNNRLNGSIPHCFKNLNTSLSVLDLRANNFAGHIPDIFVPKNTLRTVRLSQNQLKGTLPRSLEYCQNLEVLDLSENELEGRFPDWLGALPNLQVLVLRSNKFHGLVGSSRRYDRPFVKLRILDISDNKFHGLLPAEYIAQLKAMKIEEKSGARYMGVEGGLGAYQDSIEVQMKGMEIELVKILTLFTTIDFSSNFFEGEIPKVIGDLKALKGLNLSHNNLSGNIPSSLGNLTNLEWLDLSSNKLGGEIPRGLADLAWLGCLNLSYNQLTGPIPRSTQFDTFNYSFDGNPGLCGHPLPNECGADARQKQPAYSHEDEEETESGNWVEWRAIPIGYGCGLVFGISAGYVMLETRRPRWLARMIERKLLKKRCRTRKNVARGNHDRRSRSGR